MYLDDTWTLEKNFSWEVLEDNITEKLAGTHYEGHFSVPEGAENKQVSILSV